MFGSQINPHEYTKPKKKNTICSIAKLLFNKLVTRVVTKNENLSIANVMFGGKRPERLGPKLIGPLIYKFGFH